MRSPSILALVLMGLLACVGTWERVRAEDTAAAYHRFLREHPDSDQAPEARARLALVRLRSKPTAEGYDSFRAEFPDESLLPELQAIAERSVFERARASGTAEAYRAFLADFGAGEYTERARGNAEFLEADGFGARPDELAAFAERNPTSDFAVEAKRSAETISVRSRSSFRSVGLRVEIAPGTPSPDRLIRVFTERATRRYAEAGLALVPLAGDRDPREASLPVRLTIRHDEATERSDFATDHVSASGILATTRVTLTRKGEQAPFWSDEFHFRAPGAIAGEASVLFGVGTQNYWASFFVPVATWDTSAAVRAARGLDKPVASVAVSEARAIVLFTDGDLEMFDVGDPQQPVPLGAYRHKRDLTRWSGLQVAGDRIALFGPDGIEVLALQAGRFAPVLALDRGTVGSIIAVESLGRDWVAAGNRGLVLIGEGKARPEPLLEREVRGLARIADRVLFTDGTSLFVSTVPLLRERRVESELRLGRGFGPGPLRVDGDRVIVIAQRGVAVADLSVPGAPRLESRVETAEAGEIRDAARIAGRLFLLGDRGLQLTDARGSRVVDSACVVARMRVAPAGRHLVMIGEKTLQVVDATPFLAGPGLAAPLP
ncbi:MAG TPA: hypothetical protein VII72_00580 [Myxococcota bacterium]